MDNEPTRKQHGSDLVHSIRATPATLWLLQKDDTGFLYFSFLFSTIAHVILFLIMVATRIFHPFAGTSAHFDLVWISPASTPGATETVKTIVPVPAKMHTPEMPSPPKNSPPEASAAAQPSQPATAPATPPEKPLETTADNTKTVPDASRAGDEMVVTRYGGKVAEVLESKTEVPLFKAFSSTQLKSSAGKADVREIIEKKLKPPSPVRVAKTAEGNGLKKATANGGKEKRDTPVTTTSSTTAPAGDSKAVLPPRHFQGPYALTNDPSRPAQGTSGPVNTGTTDRQPRVASAGKPGVQEALKPVAPDGGNGAVQTSGNKAAIAPPAPVLARNPVQPQPASETVAEKPKAPPTEKPRAIFHPPLSGDLKLVITADREVKVEAVFREFRKARRGKALSRWEDRNRRNLVPKAVRTGENSYEAAIETTEEGIYELRVRAADDRPVDAAFVLKIRESRPGAVTKRLGKRSVPQATTIAMVLMPDGILWDDDSSFTGNMEDSGSVTKFNAETGLIWREYK